MKVKKNDEDNPKWQKTRIESYSVPQINLYVLFRINHLTRHIHGTYIRDGNTKQAAHALSIFCENNLKFAIKMNALNKSDNR